MSSYLTSWTAARQASLSLTISGTLLKLMSIESAMPSNHLILCCPLLLIPTIFPSIRVFSSESALHIQRPNYWSFSFSIGPSNEYAGLISSRMDWFDLLASRCITTISAPIFTWLSSFCASSPLIIRLLFIELNSLLD